VLLQVPGAQGDPLEHSFTSTHVAESPEPCDWKPAPQPHTKPPTVSVQVLSALRFRPHVVAVAHSFTFTQVVPLNV
jgi:hypothetical protein